MPSAPGYVCKNRHGIYQFRGIIPLALQPRFARKSREVRRSLKTSSFRLATKRARRYLWRFEQLIEKLMEDAGESDQPDVTPEELDRILDELEAEDAKPYWGPCSVDPNDQPDRSPEALELQRQQDVRKKVEREVRLAIEAQTHDADRVKAIEEIASEKGMDPERLTALLLEQKQGPAQAESTARHAKKRIKFAALVEEYLEALLADKRVNAAKTITINREYRPKLLFFAQVVGDRYADELAARDIEYLRGCVYKAPSRLAQILKRDELSISEVLDQDHSKYLSPTTVTKYHQQLKSLCGWAAARKYTETDLSSGIKFESTKKPKIPVVPFDADDLAKIFGGFLYKGEIPKRVAVHPYQFWLPILALYTGARLNELCQLQTEDIQFDPVTQYWFLDINEIGDDKSTKTTGSIRRVPIHRKLETLGFPDFAKLDSAGPVFATGLSHTQENGWGGNASRWFNRDEDNGGRASLGYFARCGVQKRDDVGRWKKSFHSFRHTFIDTLREANVSNERIAPIVGHEPGTITGRYGIRVQSNLRREVEVIEELVLPLDLAALSFEDFRRRSNLQ